MPQKIKNLRRPVHFPLFLGPEEREYISREALELTKTLDRDYSQNELVVRRTMRRGWKMRLSFLRKKQAGVKDRRLWVANGRRGK
jgi:hypothetical protein